MNVIIDEHVQLENIDEPSRRWRNLYLALVHYQTIGGQYCEPGKKYWGSKIWPCKDAAETAALTDPDCSAVRGYSEYLGAFPVTP